jgi:hypothetical protein
VVNLKMAVIVDCKARRKNKAGIPDATVCKNYHAKIHKYHRFHYNKRKGKYQSHGNKKMYRIARANAAAAAAAAAANNSFVLPPNVTTRRKRQRTV